MTQHLDDCGAGVFEIACARRLCKGDRGLCACDYTAAQVLHTRAPVQEELKYRPLPQNRHFPTFKILGIACFSCKRLAPAYKVPVKDIKIRHLAGLDISKQDPINRGPSAQHFMPPATRDTCTPCLREEIAPHSRWPIGITR